MKHFHSLCVLFLGLFVTGLAARAENPALHGGAMLFCSGLPCVDVTVKNGKHLRMLVDLGDESSIIDSSVAREMGLIVDPVQPLGPDGKRITTGYGQSTLEGVHLGDASLGDVHVLVMDIASGIKKNQLPQSDGTLAYTVFKDRLLQLDYKRQTVRVSEPLTTNLACSGFCGDVTMPTFGKGRPHVLVTTGFSVNGKPITAQIDTLYAGTMVIYPDSVAKLGLQQENSAATATRFFNFTDGGVPMRESHAQTEAFANKALAHNAALFFATPTVHVPDGMFDGTVGAGLFVGHILHLDLHAQHFWMTN